MQSGSHLMTSNLWRRRRRANPSGRFVKDVCWQGRASAKIPWEWTYSRVGQSLGAVSVASTASKVGVASCTTVRGPNASIALWHNLAGGYTYEVSNVLLPETEQQCKKAKEDRYNYKKNPPQTATLVTAWMNDHVGTCINC